MVISTDSISFNRLASWYLLNGSKKRAEAERELNQSPGQSVNGAPGLRAFKIHALGIGNARRNITATDAKMPVLFYLS